MLTTLRISGFAVVDRVEVTFGPGLNVLTGETGAGKSIVLEALHLVLGGRMSAEVLREGADEAVVEALFQLPPEHPVFTRLLAGGVPASDGGELLVRRTAARSGRGRAFVNGALCTVGFLESALRGLVDVTGQHEHVALLDEGTHAALLDAYAARRARAEAPVPGAGEGAGLAPPARYREAYGRLAAALRERDALRTAAEERARRADWLAYQLREIEALAPEPGEDRAREAERAVLASAARLREVAELGEALVYGEEGSAVERIGRALRVLTDASGVDPRLAPTAALLRSALAEAEEAGRALGRYADAASGDPERLAAVEERLEALRALARKHGGSLEAALARAQGMRAELAAAQASGDRLAALEVEIARAGSEAVALARALTAERTRAAEAFCAEVARELEALAMARCRVEVELLPPEGGLQHDGLCLGPDGAERARILLAPNVGEPARPLARVASGGELSRVLLAAKRALAASDGAVTYAFDEVDAGIGGAVADAVGRLLAEIARERQVLCVTHLAQVAAHAGSHLKVEKRLGGGRTFTEVRALAAEERRREVARMLAGEAVTPVALEHAAELLAAAQAHLAAPAGCAKGRAGSLVPQAAAAGRRVAPARSAARTVSARRRAG